MKEIRIIGDEIYYDNTLVAKLVESPMHTVQGEFVEEINSFDDYDTDDDIDTDEILDCVNGAIYELNKIKDSLNA